jgi:hypothetical protein
MALPIRFFNPIAGEMIDKTPARVNPGKTPRFLSRHSGESRNPVFSKTFKDHGLRLPPESWFLTKTCAFFLSRDAFSMLRKKQQPSSRHAPC